MVFFQVCPLRKRKKIWFKNSLLNRTRLSGFLILSLGLHISFVIAHMLIPVHKTVVKGPPPIQVKYVENKKEQDSKYGKIVDAPKQPLKKEKPDRIPLPEDLNKEKKEITKKKQNINTETHAILVNVCPRREATQEIIAFNDNTKHDR